MRRFVLLDRDGTVNREVHYLSSASQVALYPGVGEALCRMRRMGLGLLVLTNQSALSRGLLSVDELDRIHSRLRDLLAEHDVELDGLYYCPHTPEDNCCCRKPRPGMVEEAVARFGFDPVQAFVIGDKPCDIELGQVVGATTILVRTGYGNEYAGSDQVAPDYVVENLGEAADVIGSLLSTQAGEAL